MHRAQWWGPSLSYSSCYNSGRRSHYGKNISKFNNNNNNNHHYSNGTPVGFTETDRKRKKSEIHALASLHPRLKPLRPHSPAPEQPEIGGDQRAALRYEITFASLVVPLSPPPECKSCKEISFHPPTIIHQRASANSKPNAETRTKRIQKNTLHGPWIEWHAERAANRLNYKPRKILQIVCSNLISSTRPVWSVPLFFYSLFTQFLLFLCWSCFPPFYDLMRSNFISINLFSFIFPAIHPNGSPRPSRVAVAFFHFFVRAAAGVFVHILSIKSRKSPARPQYVDFKVNAFSRTTSHVDFSQFHFGALVVVVGVGSFALSTPLVAFPSTQSYRIQSILTFLFDRLFRARKRHRLRAPMCVFCREYSAARKTLPAISPKSIRVKFTWTLYFRPYRLGRSLVYGRAPLHTQVRPKSRTVFRFAVCGYEMWRMRN